MDLWNGNTSTNIGTVKHHLSIKTSRAQQGGVKHIGTVCGSNHNHIGVCVKAIHLYKNLIQRLLALIMRSAQSRATLATDRIDFCNEADTTAIQFRLVKESSHATGANSNKHF